MTEPDFLRMIGRASRRGAARFGVPVEDALAVDHDFRYRDRRIYTLVVRPGVVHIHDHGRKRLRMVKDPGDMTAIQIADITSVEAEWSAPMVWAVTIQTAAGPTVYDTIPDSARVIRDAIAAQMPSGRSVAPEVDGS